MTAQSKVPLHFLLAASLCFTMAWAAPNALPGPSPLESARAQIRESILKIHGLDSQRDRFPGTPADLAALAETRKTQVRRIVDAGNSLAEDTVLQRETVQALFSVGELNRALDFANRVVALDDLAEDSQGLEESLALRALVWQKQGNVEQAYEDSVRACGLNPANSTACQTVLMTRGRTNPKKMEPPSAAVAGELSQIGASTASMPGRPGASPGKGLRVSPVPSPGSKPTAQSRIEALPYEPRIKKYLGIMAQYADPGDTESTLGALERFKPEIWFRSFLEKSPYRGVAFTNFNPFGNRPVIQIVPGYAAPPENIPGPSAARFSAFRNPENRREYLGHINGARVYKYVDGSTIHEYSDEEITGTLMHEIQHVRRAGELGGANRLTDELDAFDIGFRFYTRYQQNNSGNIHLVDVDSFLEEWQVSPDLFQESMKGTYANHSVQTIRVELDEQLSRARKRRQDEEAAAGWKGPEPGKEPPPGVAKAQREEEKVTQDIFLHRRANQEQKTWRVEREREFREWAQSKVDQDQKAAAQMPENTESQRAVKHKISAEIEADRKRYLENPWFFIPKLEVKSR